MGLIRDHSCNIKSKITWYTTRIKNKVVLKLELSAQTEETRMKITKASVLIAGLLAATAAFGGVEEGKTMFNEAKCIECHNTSDFENSKKVHSFKELEQRVQACQLNTDAGWFDEDVTDVANYLNNDFYKFKNEK